MGLGKTIQALWYFKRNKKSPVVVICPASLKYNWAREAAVHIRERAEILEGTKPPKKKVFKQNPFVIINYEILGPWLDYLIDLDPQLVILDECQYIKNRRAKRTRYVKQLVKGVPHVLALSGTPLTNRPAELWTTLNIIRPDLFKSFMSYALEYCNARRTPWGWEYKGAKNLDKLHDILTENCMVRRRKVDVLKDLPAKSRHVVSVPLENRHEYDEAEEDLILWLSKYSKRKANNAARAERLVKMGYLKRLAATLKLKAVTDWIDRFLEETDEKLVVFAIHRDIIKSLRSICNVSLTSSFLFSDCILTRAILACTCSLVISLSRCVVYLLMTQHVLFCVPLPLTERLAPQAPIFGPSLYRDSLHTVSSRL